MSTHATTQAPSVFESYNARSLGPKQVARTFIPPPAFTDLARRGHSVIVGPRGSGKTTLLKMLQSEALDAWNHEQSAGFRDRIDFSGVFIPTDVTWSEQIAALGDRVLDPAIQELFGRCAFTTHVLRSLTNAMDQRTKTLAAGETAHRNVQLSRWQQAEIVSTMAEDWHLDTVVPSFASVSEALTKRMQRLAELASAEVIRGRENQDQRLSEVPWLHVNAIAAATSAITKFNRVSGRPDDRWALLVDELELAPSGIVRELLRALRSTDERLIFKLSYSPFGTDLRVLDRETSGSPGNDYTIVALYYPNKQEGYRFTRSLMQGILDERGVPYGIDEFFGHSQLEYDPTDTEIAASERRADVSRMYFELARVDRSFRQYLLNRKIDPSDIRSVSGTQRAAVIRKVVGLVPIRLAFRKADQVQYGAARGRKNPAIWSGLPALFAMLEGNPRWTIGVTTQLLDEYDRRPGRRLRDSVQSAEVSKASDRFLALLRTMATSPNATTDDANLSQALESRNLPTVTQLLDTIGQFFANEVVKDQFTADPYGTFVVDESITDGVALLLGRALNAGAIVLVPARGGSPMTASLRGCRFRLSYLLAPHYELPLRLDKAISLSSILSVGLPTGTRPQHDRRKRPTKAWPGQGTFSELAGGDRP
ncbi:hypothetical protein [Cellulomonas sp. ICMP 17802]|uniref:ORC-CDC6 family AAA ATPase n=1 Tax=Cellulomonas sp. ICMP 17802 TaxID=3239199 RepID=UPI00351BB125